MNTQYAFWRSKTFWTVVAMFIIGGFNNVQDMIPASALPFVQGFLSILAAYFHVSTAKAFGARN